MRSVLYILFFCLFSFEVVFAYSAQRANPIFRNIFPCCARLNSVIRITDFRIINITADSAYILIHNFPPVNQSKMSFPTLAFYNYRICKSII